MMITGHTSFPCGVRATLPERVHTEAAGWHQLPRAGQGSDCIYTESLLVVQQFAARMPSVKPPHQ